MSFLDKFPKAIRKRLTLSILTSLGTIVIVPFLIKQGINEEAAVQLWTWGMGLIAAAILGQSYTDAELIRQGKKER